MHCTPLANGIRTDHPIPGLPFVDDSMLDLTDRASIEVIGRGAVEGQWGRADPLAGSDSDWTAFTTIPHRPTLAWSVRHYEDYGTTVTLVADDDAASAHELSHEPVLTRAGGYWWDGATWYRPESAHDPVTREVTHSPVPEAKTITVATVLTRDQPQEPKALTPLDEITTDTPALTHEVTAAWVANHLSAWLIHHTDPADWDRAVVTVAAPELESSHMLTVAAVAQNASLSQDTIRSYLSRDQMPAPQTRIPAIMWSAPVITDWRRGVARRHAPHVEVRNDRGNLETLTRDLVSALAPRLLRGRLTQAQIQRVGRIVGEHTLGLGRDFQYAGTIHGRQIASACHSILGGTRRHFGDREITHLIALIETNKVAAMFAVEVTVREAVGNVRRQAELDYATATAHIAQQAARAARAELNHLKALQSGDIPAAEQAKSEQSYALAAQDMKAHTLQTAKEALARVASGEERELVENALRSHPFIVERPELVAWIDHTLSPR